MSLGKFLSAGRSLVLGEDQEHRYRLPRNSWLPKFGPEQNPFEVEAKADRQTEHMLPADRAVAPEEPPQVPNPAQEPAVVRRPGWLSRLNPFAVSGGGIPGLRGMAAGRSGGVRQVELSLGAVKVVRNDLGDEEDVKLKPLKAQRPAARAAMTSTPERAVEEATVTRLNKSCRRAEQFALF